jgi:thiamin-phosphate kinase
VKTKKILPLGKLDFPILSRLLKKHEIILDPRVVLGPKLGEDAAVIEFPDRYLVVKTDPITFATEEIGWYAVQVNANDIATTGAVPKWFLVTVLLPEGKTTEKEAEKIVAQISQAAKTLGVSVVGGHTEVTYNLDRPIVVGMMLGEVAREKLVSTSGAKPGDTIILTKGVAIEGTTIIAREKREELRQRGHSEEFIRKCQNFLHKPGLSVVRDALLANQFEVHAMHDPTEGGLSAGLYEVAQASQVGLLVDRAKIPILEESSILCKEYGLDPLKTIASGALLIIAPPESVDSITSVLGRHNILAATIGEIKEKNQGLKIVSEGRIENLDFSAKDEITKIFK